MENDINQKLYLMIKAQYFSLMFNCMEKAEKCNRIKDFKIFIENNKFLTDYKEEDWFDRINAKIDNLIVFMFNLSEIND